MPGPNDAEISKAAEKFGAESFSQHDILANGN